MNNDIYEMANLVKEDPETFKAFKELVRLTKNKTSLVAGEIQFNLLQSMVKEGCLGNMKKTEQFILNKYLEVKT